jgi:transitional endoplasmic reticulum ATPase
MMDGLEERGQVVVIGATNRVDAIDPALRRPGRFDREIEIGVPSEPDRIDIMKIHTRGMPLAEDVSLEGLGQRTHGFVGADLAALAREAAIRALRRYLPEINLDVDEIEQEILDRMEVNAGDFRSALRDVSPSAMREVMLEVTHVTWNDVGGLEDAKQEVREAVELPLTERSRFDELGIDPPRGVLLYGPPGTGKTLIAKAVAHESGANFIAIRGPQLLSKWVGESERAVREIFKKARQVAPSIIFFDELDALAPARGGELGSHVMETVLNQILTEIDGLEELKDVVVMAATNQPTLVDPALLRAGRFDRLVYIGEPDREGRRIILAIHLRYTPLAGSHLEELIEYTGRLDETMLDAVLDRLGNSRVFTLDEARAVADTVVPEKEGTLSRGQRRRFIRDHMAERGLTLRDEPRDAIIGTIADRTEGYVGADLEGLCREAGIFAMRERANAVTLRHFEQSLEKIHPTMNERLRESYSRIRQHFKGGLPRDAQPPEYQ